MISDISSVFLPFGLSSGVQNTSPNKVDLVLFIKVLLKRTREGNDTFLILAADVLCVPAAKCLVVKILEIKQHKSQNMLRLKGQRLPLSASP